MFAAGWRQCFIGTRLEHRRFKRDQRPIKMLVPDSFISSPCEMKETSSATRRVNAKALIDFLANETRLIAKATSTTEEWNNYFADLIQAVGLLKDERAAPVLVQPFVLERGGISTRALAVLGEPADLLVVRTIDGTPNVASVDGGLYVVSLMTVLDELLAHGETLSSEASSTTRP